MSLNQSPGQRERRAPSGGAPRTAGQARVSDSRPSDPQASIARYTSLAMNAAASGDRVQAESYHQHAEYFRKVLHGTLD